MSAAGRVPRRRTVAVLVLLAALICPLAITAVWLRETVLDTHHFVTAVAPLSSNPAIDAAIAGEITSALLANVNVAKEAGQVLPSDASFLALPLSTGVRDYTETLVAKFLATAEFRQLWVAATTQAHEALVAVLEGKQSPFLGPDGSVEINLTSVVLAARHALGLSGLHEFDNVAASALHRRFVIVRPAALNRARRGVNALRALAIVLPALTIVLAALALLLTRERTRTIFRLGAAVAATCVVGLVAVTFARRFYLSNVVGPDVSAAAARALYDTVLRNLRLWLELAALAGLLAAGTAVLAGPSRLAAGIRSRTLAGAGTLADGAVGASVTARFVAANKGTLRTITVVLGLLLLLTASHLTLRLFLELGVGVVLVLGLLEVLARPGSPGRRRAT